MTRKKAILYVRVSTDEQADRGFSLQHQEERLRNYCQLQGIDVVGFYREDHSAKSFERPEFTKLLGTLKKDKKLADLLLFLKWDRFSRNAADAYYMISTLNKLGIEPQAIEQPLDLNIPENKIMLAFYLAAPEVENDRRALNTIAGMRRANKEGRWTGKAPVGYKNARDDRNRPVILQSELAPVIKWVFEEIKKCVYSADQIFTIASEKGLSRVRSNFYHMIRNPFYCGIINMPAYKDEEATQIRGIHEPIITEELFNEVQDVMTGKRKNWPVKQSGKAEFPLRGFLLCKKCRGKLTASASKGRNAHYLYYHCTPKCGERFHADEANMLFAAELKKIAINKATLNLGNVILKNMYNAGGTSSMDSIERIKSDITKKKERLTNAQSLLLDGTLDSADYKEIKGKLEPEIRALESKINNLSTESNDLDQMLEFGTQFLGNLDQFYITGDLTARQHIIGSMFPEKLIFENKTFRTAQPNPLLQLITTPDAGFEDSKKRKKPKNSALSCCAPPVGLEPTTL